MIVFVVFQLLGQYAFVTRKLTVRLPKLKLAEFGQNKSLNNRDESRHCVVELFSMTKGET